jgi:hypothetical protein
MNGTLMSLAIVEAVLTAAAILMFLYRGALDMKEEDHIILNNAEAHLARDQAAIRRKLDMLSRYIKIVAIAWSVVLLVLFGLWVGQGLGLL